MSAMNKRVEGNTNSSPKLYRCPECGLHYRDEQTAEKCRQWCKEYKSCNLEITQYAEENKENESLN